MSTTETVKFDVPVVGWLINVSTVTSPVKRRRRVLLHGGVLSDGGRLVKAVFTLKGVVYSFKYGQVFESKSGDLKMENFEVWTTDKWYREHRNRQMIEWACNPKSEAYWSM